MSDPRRPVGRPRVDTSGTSKRVSVTVTIRDYDRLCRHALRDGISVAELFRRQLQDDGDDDSDD